MPGSVELSRLELGRIIRCEITKVVNRYIKARSGEPLSARQRADRELLVSEIEESVGPLFTKYRLKKESL